ncbi:MAG: hypothetical protein K0R54_4655 [Clostridiaceae bacterium]|nr:hypothetical protein [Clostridiaceae bacterium]
MMNMADYFGNTSGYDKNKCDDIEVKYTRGAVLNAPILEESPWVYECSLVETIKVNDGCIYIGEVKNILIDKAIEDTSYGKIDLVSIDPLIYAPGHYYKIESSIGSVGYSIVESNCRSGYHTKEKS